MARDLCQTIRDLEAFANDTRGNQSERDNARRKADELRAKLVVAPQRPTPDNRIHVRTEPGFRYAAGSFSAADADFFTMMMSVMNRAGVGAEYFEIDAMKEHLARQGQVRQPSDREFRQEFDFFGGARQRGPEVRPHTERPLKAKALKACVWLEDRGVQVSFNMPPGNKPWRISTDEGTLNVDDATLIRTAAAKGWRPDDPLQESEEQMATRAAEWARGQGYDVEQSAIHGAGWIVDDGFSPRVISSATFLESCRRLGWPG